MAPEPTADVVAVNTDRNPDRERTGNYSFGYAPGSFPAGTTHRIEVSIPARVSVSFNPERGYKVR